MEKIIRNRKIIKDVLLFTVLPLCIPMILCIPDYLVNKCISSMVVIVAVIFDAIFSIKFLMEKEKEKEKDANEEWLHKSVRIAYSGAHNIFERKRIDLSHETEVNRIDIKSNLFPYDIHSHIIDICQELKSVIASITQINEEAIDTVFIYRYGYEINGTEDIKWKWVGYRNPMSNYSLDDFVKNKETVFFHLINDNIYYIFGNDKKSLASKKMYHLGARDKMYEYVGSIFGIKVVFGNNTTNLVEGIITVSSYGKRFADNDCDPDMLRNMIIDEIFPYYRTLLETELGLLYTRHVYRTKNP